MSNPTNAQLNKAMDKIEEELQTIIFMFNSDRQKYGNILDQMENDVLQKKDPFPKTVSEASTLMVVGKINRAITLTNIMKQTTVWLSQQMQRRKILQ